MVQAVCHVRSQARPCGIYGEQGSFETGLRCKYKMTQKTGNFEMRMLRCCKRLLHLHWTTFHNFTKPGFNRLGRHRTLQGNQWQLCENCSVTMSSQDSVTFPGPQDHRICPFLIFSCGATLRIGSTRLDQGHWMNWNKESKTKFVVSQLGCCSEQWGTSTADWKNAYVEEDAIYRT